MMIPNETDLIKELQQGRYTRFSLLVDGFSKLCVHYFLVTCRCDLETAKDLTQSAFFRVFRSLAKFTPGRPFTPWLMGICRNLAIDQINSIQPTEIFHPETGGRSSAEMEADLGKKLSVRQAIGKLPGRQAEIIELRYFWDLECTEIAKIVGIPVGTVKSDLFYARLRLMELLEEWK